MRAELAQGGEYTNDNVAIFEFEDGLVRRYHDYFDPRRFQVVVDALAATANNSTVTTRMCWLGGGAGDLSRFPYADAP